MVTADPGPGVTDPSTHAVAGDLSPDWLSSLGAQLRLFLLEYEFGLREVETKIGILRDEFLHMHDHNPIEHVTSRVSPRRAFGARCNVGVLSAAWTVCAEASPTLRECG